MIIMTNLPRLGRLRVLLTTKCNLNCLYCHKEGQFNKRYSITYNELKGLLKLLTNYGIDEVKFSGGEPLLYNHINEIINYTKNELNIKKVSVTTNGILLGDKIEEFEKSGLDELSISLDTLNPGIFKELNGGNDIYFNKTLKNISKAAKSSIPEVNLNITLTSKNIDEIPSLVEYAKNLNIPVRLISFIDVGKKTSKKTSDLVVNLDDLIRKMNSLSNIKYNPKKEIHAYTNFTINNYKITFVDSVCPDCVECGKRYAIRLTTDGKLKPCLISEKGEIDIIAPYRKKDKKELNFRIERAIALKRYGLTEFMDIPERYGIRNFFLNPF